ncbi:MAG: hypothetical protein AAFO58_12685 [Pseudomonadota bacterium]
MTILLAGSSWSASSSMDFINNRRLLVIYVDGVPKEMLNYKQPVVNSWRKNKLEVRNMCKTIECNYDFLETSVVPNRFISRKCYVEHAHTCEMITERRAVTVVEKVIHEADYGTTIDLGGEKFAILANSNTEDAIIMEVGDQNIVTKAELSGDLHKKVKKI